MWRQSTQAEVGFVERHLLVLTTLAVMVPANVWAWIAALR